MSGGDIDADELRTALHQVADLVADYLEQVGDYPVLPPTQPGDVLRELPVRVFVEPDTNVLLQANTNAGGKLRQVAFDAAVMRQPRLTR